MNTEILMAATLDECNRVLARYPDLTAPGFDSYYAILREREDVRSARDGLPPIERNEPTPITEPDGRREISSARLFLTENCCRTKTIRRGIGSYGLKHKAELWLDTYISNGAFIAAVYLEGYAIERNGPNANFSLSYAP
ncbi:MAG: hypothetical protein ABI356_14540 [Steroidobacteraceae bacterium]